MVRYCNKGFNCIFCEKCIWCDKYEDCGNRRGSHKNCFKCVLPTSKEKEEQRPCNEII